MTSPPTALARRRESADFPAAVGPTTATVSPGLSSAGNSGPRGNSGLGGNSGPGGLRSAAMGISLAAAGMAMHNACPDESDPGGIMTNGDKRDGEGAARSTGTLPNGDFWSADARWPAGDRGA